MTQSAHEEDLVRDDELLFDRLREPANGHGRSREGIREGDVLGGRYAVERIRRRSGLLFSAEARHIDLGERVLMMLLPSDGRTYPDTAARFLRDARAAARIRSEHAARVTDVGWLVSGSPYAVTEFPRGTDLTELVRTRGPLPVVEALDYVVQACEAVAESHALDIVHASLSPSNLLLSRAADGSPLVKVLGFGVSETWLAGPADDRSTGPVEPGSLAQALGYFAPEQIRDASTIDGRVDVWALGAILHELLTGLPAYRSRNLLALATMIAADPPPPITVYRADVPPVLEEVIIACLAKDPAARFGSVADLTLALRPFASPEGQSSVERVSRISGMSSRPPTVTQRLGFPASSQPSFVAPGALVAPPGVPSSRPLSRSRPLPTPTPPPLPRSDSPSTSRSLASPVITRTTKTSRPVRLDSMASYGPAEGEASLNLGKHAPWIAAGLLGVMTAIAAQVVLQRQRHTMATVERPLVPNAPAFTLAKPQGESPLAPVPLPRFDAMGAAPIGEPVAAPAAAAPGAAAPERPAPSPARAKDGNPYDDAPKGAPTKRSKGLFDDAD